MLSQDRQKRIHDLMRKQRSALVTDLSTQLGISTSTVRRDLSELETRGLVQRVHGGAILVEGDQGQAEKEAPVVLRADVNGFAKERIGQAAAAMVNDGETIILSAGTTVETMLPHLVHLRNLTVITNVVKIAYQLSAYPQVSVVVLGGWLRHSEYSLLGHLTHQALHDLYATKIFHGTFGLDPDYGLTGTYVQEAETDRHLISAAGQLIVLADSSKFEHVGPVRIVPTQRIDTLITNTDAPKAQVEKVQACGVRVLCV